MDTYSTDVEPVTLSDVLDLASWDRPRSSEELQGFVTSHLSSLPDSIELL